MLNKPKQATYMLTLFNTDFVFFADYGHCGVARLKLRARVCPPCPLRPAWLRYAKLKFHGSSFLVASS